MKSDPKCRLCGHNHSMREPHIWDEPVANAKKDVANKLANVKKSMANTGIKMANELANAPKHMANGVANKKEGGGGADGGESLQSTGELVGGSASDLKTRTYRYRDIEKRREYMREYMKRKRG